jgi:hypothetical protein
VSTAPGADRSGAPSRTVAIAFAWISGPDIRPSPGAGVSWTSWSTVAVSPTTTTFPASARASGSRSTTDTQGTFRTVPGGPA